MVSEDNGEGGPIFSSARSWLNGPEGKALKFALGIEVISIFLDALIAVIESLQQHPRQQPFSGEIAADVLAIHSDLIFVGLGALVGSYLSAPRTTRRAEPLLGPFVAVMTSLLVIALLHAVWPWIGPLWLRVLLTDVIGVCIIIYCVRMAFRVRRP